MNVYVANLSREMTEDSLRFAFSAFGQVRAVTITRDEATGEASAFVSMPIVNEAQTAIRRMNGKDLDGRTIQVEKSRIRPNILEPGNGQSEVRKDPRKPGKRSGSKRGAARRGGAKRNRRGRGSRGKRMKS